MWLVFLLLLLVSYWFCTGPLFSESRCPEQETLLGQEGRRMSHTSHSRGLHTRLVVLVKLCKSSKAAWDLKSCEGSK